MVSRVKGAAAAASLALVLGVVVGSTAVLGSAGPGPSGAGPALQADQPEPDRPAGPIKPEAVTGITPELEFVPVAPCRLVDTRLGGGRLAAGTDRGFDARGTGSLAAQGGSATGCGLPLNAATISVNVAAVKPAAGGFLRGWAQGTTEPGTAFMNVAKSVTLNGLTIQGLGDPHETLDFRIRNGAGAMHLVVDVTGYYIAPMAATLLAGGTLHHGSRVVSTAKLGPGAYEVLFDRDVDTCYYHADSLDIERTIVVAPRIATPNGVYVEFENIAGDLVDTNFYLSVNC
jgi:hypothetical protein